MSKKASVFSFDSVDSIDDYTQSANALFHFMKRQAFLKDALKAKALIPRFCLEDIHYLNLSVDDEEFGEIAILQKCFCDIPLHKIAANIELSLTEECKKNTVGIEETKIARDNTHVGFYGQFAIAFSKSWCEQKNLQPIHYLNSDAAYARDFSALFKKAASGENLFQEFAEDIIHRLALVKPLRGKMKRQVQTTDMKIDVEVYKNFHDEQEWRYVPDLTTVAHLNKKLGFEIPPIVANPHLLSLQIVPEKSYLEEQSQTVSQEECKSLWLDFEYKDIRYLIVPDNESRLDFIDFIMDLPSTNFTRRASLRERHLLLSKILVLSEIGKDW